MRSLFSFVVHSECRVLFWEDVYGRMLLTAYFECGGMAPEKQLTLRTQIGDGTPC